jgi:phosphomannomutase / phosphoglucomutase
MLARDLAAVHKSPTFVADVKSTGLFASDPVLKSLGAKTLYWKTGHSYMKRYTHEQKALVGFEKSGHYFFQPPLGKGYDDGLVAAIAICDMLERAPGKSMADLKRALPKTWQSPTMSPKCGDTVKYGIVDKIVAQYQDAHKKGEKIAGQAIVDLVTVNGVRVTLTDGTWGLVRASSNKPELVVVVESPVSEANRNAMFADIKARFAAFPEIGKFNQEL